MAGALVGLRVFDASDSIAGQFCGRMLADYGAAVRLLEPPAGSAVRRKAPFHPDGSSLRFLHLNTGKCSVTLNHSCPSGRLLLTELTREADVVIAGRGLDRTALRAANPRLVSALVSDFGEDGPLCDWRGTELVYQALAGAAHRNGSHGQPPLYGTADRAAHGAGVGAYIAILAALYAREGSHQGQDVAVDVAQTTSSMTNPFMTQYVYSGLVEPRGERRLPLIRVLCRDGWVGVWVHLHRWRSTCTAFGLPQLADDPRFSDPKTRLDNWPALNAIFQEIAVHESADDLLHRLLEAHAVAARAYRLSELWNDCTHLAERGYWEQVSTAQGSRPILGPQFRMSATPRQTPSGPPTLGEDNDQVYQALGLTASERAALRNAGVI
jgi:crotonobetainyl-CoA:carnitine CoA-transferase CaiB-like acyl-CoA transferase